MTAIHPILSKPNGIFRWISWAYDIKAHVPWKPHALRQYCLNISSILCSIPGLAITPASPIRFTAGVHITQATKYVVGLYDWIAALQALCASANCCPVPAKSSTNTMIESGSAFMTRASCRGFPLKKDTPRSLTRASFVNSTCTSLELWPSKDAGTTTTDEAGIPSALALSTISFNWLNIRSVKSFLETNWTPFNMVRAYGLSRASNCRTYE